MFQVPESNRVLTGMHASDASYENNGQFIILKSDSPLLRESRDISGLLTQASDGEGWEHVSVSVINKKNKKRRLPNHREMECVRFLFWGKNDWVIEFHPPTDEYVNNAPCLHLWRPTEERFPTPNSILVGTI